MGPVDGSEVTPQLVCLPHTLRLFPGAGLRMTSAEANLTPTLLPRQTLLLRSVTWVPASPAVRTSPNPTLRGQWVGKPCRMPVLSGHTPA